MKVTMDDIVLEAYRELARKAFPIGEANND